MILHTSCVLIVFFLSTFETLDLSNIKYLDSENNDDNFIIINE